MGPWIDGWVEAAPYGAGDEPDGWVGLVSLGPLVDVCDAVSEHLFGLFHHAGQDVRLFESRGLPEHPSPEVLRDMLQLVGGTRGELARWGAESWSDIDPETLMRMLPQDVAGPTHATWSEIKAAIGVRAFDEVIARHPYRSTTLRDSDWALVFDLIRRLEDDHRFTDHHLRLVVWTAW